MIVHFACLKSERAFIIQKEQIDIRSKVGRIFRKRRECHDCYSRFRRVVATTSSVSSIIDDTLTYVGYNIDDLAENATFEEVVYLLWHRKLPNEQELAKFNEIVSEYYKVP